MVLPSPSVENASHCQTDKETMTETREDEQHPPAVPPADAPVCEMPMPPPHWPRPDCHRGHMFRRGCVRGRPGWPHPPFVGNEGRNRFPLSAPRTLEQMVPTLYDADGPGLAEQIRLCFVLGGVEFIDRRMTLSQWETKYKALSPSGTMPFMVVDGTVLSQSRALLLYAAKRSGLMPAPADETQALTMIGLMLDAMQTLNRSMHNNPDVDAAAKLLFETVMPQVLGRLDAMLFGTQDSMGHSIGGKLTYVDACITGTLRAWSFGCQGTPYEVKFEESLATHCPHFIKVRSVVMSHPRVVNWLNKNPLRPDLYYEPNCWKAEVLMRYMDLHSLNYNKVELTEGMKGSKPVLPWMSHGTCGMGGLYACLAWIDEWRSRRGAENLGSDEVKTDEENAKFSSYVDCFADVLASFAEDPESARLEAEIGALNKLIQRTQHEEGFVLGSALSVVDIMAAVLFRRLTVATHTLSVSQSSLEGLKRSYCAYVRHPIVHRKYLASLPKPELYYFNIPAMVEGCRLMFHVSGIPFVDKQIEFQEWIETYKSQSATGKTPWLKIGEVEYYEALAVNKLVAELTGFEPVTFEGRHMSNVIASFFLTRIPAVSKNWFRTGERTGEEDASGYFRENLSPIFDELEQMIQKCQLHGNHTVENRFTWIDFYLAGEYEHARYKKVIEDDNLEAARTRWPSWTRVHDAVYELPAVQKYVAGLQPRIPFAVIWGRRLIEEATIN
eukprot:Gregarina_sp_Poly_1__4103@NODE_224_length_11220_cov_343_477450_g198_i0_p2_GENE_NODE_224_length_11220_cov_343_477450_g198_i0NODE_224_length_11220_cov_343_477450_g198_i0_p2_ORF_typecomplete_len725_score84_44GST_C_3/PF14497_6/0_00016GST_C_3/PF14497_6/0_004GST_C_3/PF14497_6/2e08GST_N/PF02798_20/3e10GST_N/PF02798_20/1_8e03GST_N/PF02798_20/0_002GST_N/PF02798_20/4_6e03GST_N_3/PF13417_6/6_4e05GST_N_3/PF13417_6/79GST_N_3/PF13417_6/2GST_C_2/PF13410_6/15GST_C_2/PF13410_6/0_0064GST_C_2/PF13410_6/2_5e02GST_C